MTKWIYHKKTRVLISISVLIFLLSLALLYNNKHLLIKPVDLNPLAIGLVKLCENQKSTQDCYNEKIPALSHLTMEDKFLLIKNIQSRTVKYPYCHMAAHMISGAEVDNDPKNLESILKKCPSDMCDSGCYHGAMIEIFNGKKLSKSQIGKTIKELSPICSSTKDLPLSINERTMCYHGLGHTMNILAKGDVKDSLAMCDAMALTSGTASASAAYNCYRGSFMQSFQPLMHGTSHNQAQLSDPESLDVEFCEQFNGRIREGCYIESTSPIRHTISTHDDLIRTCSFAKNRQELGKCYYSAVGIVTVQMIRKTNNVDGIFNFCKGFPKEAIDECFKNAAFRTVQIGNEAIDLAIQICEDARKLDLDASCFNTLATYGKNGYGIDNTGYINYCQKLPSPWDKKCIN